MFNNNVLIRSLCENKTARQQGKKDGEKEKDDRKDGEPQSLLQRVICLFGGTGVVEGRSNLKLSASFFIILNYCKT